MTPAQLQALRIVQGIAPKYSYAVSPNEWDFKEFLMAMTSRYHADVSTYDNADGIELVVQELEMSIVCVYDHPHDSDESSSVEFMLVKGVPLMGWKRVGDRSDYSDGIVVLNDEEGRTLARRVWQLVHSTDTVGEDTLDVLAWMFEDNQYLHPLTGVRQDLVAYAINNPRWMLGRINPQKHRLYAIKPDDTDAAPVLARIVRIVSTTMSAEKYASDAYHRSTVELEDGTQCEVETDCIVHTPLRDAA